MNMHNHRDTAAPLLVADVGGTNTRLAIAMDAELRSETLRRYDNKQFSNLESVIEQYLSEQTNDRLCGCCIAVAGTVNNGQGRLTNRDWVICADSLCEVVGAERVVVINDLQAIGYGVHLLGSSDVQVLKAGASYQVNDTKLVINAGTGFNAVAVHTTESGRFVAPSECGHSSLAVSEATEKMLKHHIEDTYGFACIEDVLSGRGTETVRAWIAELTGSDNQLNSNKYAYQSVMSGILGSVTGDLALTHLPYGGIYLTGGVIQALLPNLHTDRLIDAFTSKGRFTDFMDQFSICLIRDDQPALRGCAVYFWRQSQPLNSLWF